MILLNEHGTQIRGQEAAKRYANVQVVVAYMAEMYGRSKSLHTRDSI